MTLASVLRLIFVVGMLFLVVVSIFVLQTRHMGKVHATMAQKVTLVVSGGIAVAAGAIAMFV